MQRPCAGIWLSPAGVLAKPSDVWVKTPPEGFSLQLLNHHHPDFKINNKRYETKNEYAKILMIGLWVVRFESSPAPCLCSELFRCSIVSTNHFHHLVGKKFACIKEETIKLYLDLVPKS